MDLLTNYTDRYHAMLVSVHYSPHATYLHTDCITQHPWDDATHRPWLHMETGTPYAQPKHSLKLVY